ncbi:MAG: hypothetical protein ABSF68_11360 [Candidatus Acidiferrales bacterium]
MILSSIAHAPVGFLTHLADAAARSFVLACIAGLALNVSRVKSVSLRLNVWRAVLCVALIMPFLGLLLPALTFRLPAQLSQRVDEFRFAYRAVNAGTTNAESEPARPAEIARNSSDRHVSHSFANTVPESHGISEVPVAADSPNARLDLPRGNKNVLLGRAVTWTKAELAAMPWTAIAATAYLLVTLGFLLRFALGAAFIARTLVGNQTRTSSGRVRSAFRAGDFRGGASRDSASIGMARLG